MSEPQKLPLVHVRGFAGDTSGINEVVTDPFHTAAPILGADARIRLTVTPWH
ncbi:hypothetical protein [Streptomyces poriticola]|uniref:hypothetical protein n=1 Tax=Streptomyces poriticola TaxID=3120506 RepID=UPI002FCE422D